MEESAYQATFRVLSVNGPDFRAEIVLKGTPLGAIDLKIDLRDPEQVTGRLRVRLRLKKQVITLRAQSEFSMRF